MVPFYGLVLHLLVLGSYVLAVPDDVPCYDDTWVYSSSNGKCYKQMENGSKLSWDDAVNQCDAFLREVSDVKVRLVQLKTKEEAETVAMILHKVGFKEKIWIGARRASDSSDFFWEGESEPASLSFFEWSGGTGKGDCIEFSHRIDSKQEPKWELNMMIENIECSLPRAYYCEHTVLPCQNPPGGFNNDSMRFEPAVAYPRAVVKAICRVGMFMVGKHKTPVRGEPDVNETLQKDHYYCTGSRADTNVADPMRFKTKFLYSGYPVTECETLKCPLFPESLEHVDNRPEPDPGKNYLTKNFGDKIELNCSHGYVNQQNRSITETVLVCEQEDPSFNVGIWIPEMHRACVAVKCSEQELRDMVPKNAHLAKARNYDTDKVYGRQQINEFSNYGNVITIRCNESFLYPDRTIEKEVICDLKEGSITEGQYYGYSGTVLPLPTKCEETTCMFESAILKPEHHMEPYFFANNATGVWKNLTKHEGKPYALYAELRFFCLPGYETVNQQGDLNTTCSISGNWAPQLIGCIEITEKIPTSSDGRFQGIKEEAKSAKQVSSIMFILIIIFLGFILILDLTTVGRDAKTLVRNVKLQKKRIQVAKQRAERPRTTKDSLYDANNSGSQLRNRFE